MLWVGLSALAAAALIAATAWMLRTTAGLHAMIGLAGALLADHVDARGLRGSLADGFSADELRIRAGRTTVLIRTLEVTIDGLTLGRKPRVVTLTVASLKAMDVRIIVAATSRPEAIEPPADLGAPLRIDVERLAIANLVVERTLDAARPEFVLRAVEAALSLGDGLEVRRLTGDIGGNALTASGSLKGERPFAMEFGGTLDSRLILGGGNGARPQVDAPVRVTWRATDSLEQMTLFAGVTGGHGARGSLRAQLSPFAALPLRRLAADLDGIDPSAWWRGAPQGDLQFAADLSADAGATFGLSGPVRVLNRTPGPWDRKQIPVRELAASLSVDERSLEMARLRAQIGRGTVTGGFTFGWTPAARWRTDLALDNVDLALLHGAARSIAVSGTLTAFTDHAATRVRADLRSTAANRIAQLNLDLAIDENSVILDQAHLQLDRGTASASGALALTGDRAFAVNGALRDLDPGVLFSALDGQPPTRLNGQLHAEGRLRPVPVGQMRLALADSIALGRPVHGRANLDFRADDSVAVDAEFGSRSAVLTARGTLAGADGDLAQSISLALDARNLAELGLPLHGAVHARAMLSGAWRAPAVDASVALRDLRFGEQRVKRIDAALRYGGGSDGALAIEINAAGHAHPRGATVSIARATLTFQGTVSAMRAELIGHTADAAALSVRASGGWVPAESLWRGSLDALTADGVFATRLSAPAPLLAGADRLSLGPARLLIHDGRFNEVRIDWRPQRFETSGSFDALALSDSGIGAEPRLTLRGDWSLRATEVLDGALRIERSSGDVFSGPQTRRVRMGLSELRFESTVRANRLQSEAVLRGSEVGSLVLGLRAEFERASAQDEGPWRLAPKRPWSGGISGAAPSIEWINPFLSANLRDNIRVAGKAEVDVKLAGTPEAPSATGFINADALRVAWVEQGIRLDNGALRSGFAPNDKGETEFVIDSLTFAGQPRVRPQHRRITAALAGTAEGSLFASGRISLPALEGVIQVRSEKFPVLQRPDRWAIATGGANIVFSPQRVQLNGAVLADAGYIDITRRDAPSLSSDVTVRRAATTGADARPEPQVPFDFSLGIDLGPAFVVRGDGLDTRVQGALLLRHEGRGVVRATGVLETQDGVYEGFGQKLAIERGRLNFQGAVDNPGLDILALRKGLPVEVGVTVARTAANPLVRLHSEPPMADFEILSWLVLGRPADNSRVDNSALARAALGLLGGSGEGIPNQLARLLGIDDLSIRAADGGTSMSLLPRQSVAGRVRGDVTTLGGEIVSLGKRLSDNLTLSYETATSGAGNAVQLSYQLTRRVSVIARAGTENALDLVYSIAFD